MYKYRYDSSSESSDSETQIAVNPVKTLDLSYHFLNSYAIYLRFEDLANKTEPKKPENVDTLLLVHNTLDTVPLNISKFINLRTLDLSNNQLKAIPELLTQLPLTTLIAKNNQITNKGLPKSFANFTSLRVFNFSGNELTTFPEQLLEAQSLEYLYLGNNRILEIPKEICRLQRLKILCLGGNRLYDIPVTIGNLYNLQALILSDNALETLPPSIANLKNLKSLLLHKNRLRTLPTEIIALKCLTELSLRENPLVVRFVADMTYNPPSLLELAGRTIKLHNVEVQDSDLPHTLREYLRSAHRCVNPKCRGVFFDNRVEHIKFVDFCGKYRVPLLQYLCSSKCATNNSSSYTAMADTERMKRVLLG